MSLTIPNFLAFFCLFLLWCLYFLGFQSLWVIPSGLTITLILMWVWAKYVSVDKHIDLRDDISHDNQ